MRNSNYINENIRFCEILTQKRYDAEEDEMFKNLIKENLNNLTIDLNIVQQPGSKKECVYNLMILCNQLTYVKYGTEADIDLKLKVSKELARLSEIEEFNKTRYENKKYNDMVNKLSFCIGGKT